MRCSTARKLIGDYIDKNLDSGKSSSLKRHLDSCLDCQKLLQDFQKIVHGAKELEEFSPPSDVWLKVRTKLKAEKQTVQAFAPRKRERLSFLISPPALRYAVSATLLSAFIIGAVSLGLRFWKREAAPSEAERQQSTLAKLEEAERHYQLAIKALGEAITSQEQKFDPQLVAVFRKNLELIDVSIEACKQAVLSDPNSIESRNYLLAVYKQKANLLADMITIQPTSSQNRKVNNIL